MDAVYVAHGDTNRPDLAMLPDVVAILLVRNIEVQPAENASHSPAVAEEQGGGAKYASAFFFQFLAFSCEIFLPSLLGIRPRNLFVFTPKSPVSQQLLASS